MSGKRPEYEALVAAIGGEDRSPRHDSITLPRIFTYVMPGKNGNGDEESRHRHRQDTDNQLLQLREWCANAGHEIVEEYVEHVSGGKGKDKRSEFARMLENAHRRRFDLVLC